MFARFERLIDPFRDGPVEAPPSGLVAFCWYYTRPHWRAMAAVSVLGALIAIFEVMVFSFLGDLVTWLTEADRVTFLQDNAWHLAWMALVILVVLPALALLWELVLHQTVMGNYPMAIRWQVHRYLLRPERRLLSGRFRGADRHQGHADGACRARGGATDPRRVRLRGGVFHRGPSAGR